MYVCISLYEKMMIVFMIMIIYACIHVSMSLFDRVIWNHHFVGMIAYEVNGMMRFLVLWESSGKSSPDKYMRSVSCGYDLILCDYIMSMLWTGYTEGYNS